MWCIGVLLALGNCRSGALTYKCLVISFYYCFYVCYFHIFIGESRFQVKNNECFVGKLQNLLHTENSDFSRVISVCLQTFNFPDRVCLAPQCVQGWEQ